MIYAKIAAIQSEVGLVAKDIDANGTKWMSDETLKNALAPLLEKHKVISVLDKSHVKIHGKNRVIVCSFRYIDLEDDSEHHVTVEHEIGDIDITGTGMTLCSKRADIHTFRIQTTDDQQKVGLKGLPIPASGTQGKAAERQEKAVAVVEEKKGSEGSEDNPVAELYNIPEFMAAFGEATKMGIKVNDNILVKGCPVNVQALLKSKYNSKYTMLRKKEVYAAMKSGLLEEYVTLLFGAEWCKTIFKDNMVHGKTGLTIKYLLACGGRDEDVVKNYLLVANPNKLPKDNEDLEGYIRWLPIDELSGLIS